MADYDAREKMLEQLLHQFKYSPNILKLIGLCAGSSGLQDTIDAAEYILSHVTLDDYEGEMLEFWGELLGVKRPFAEELDILTFQHVGETEDPDNRKGFLDDTDTVDTGGYFTSDEGLPSVRYPGTFMSDTDYRFLIRQKSQSYRKRMTHLNLFNYLLAFGARCKLNDDETFITEIEPANYYDLNLWAQNYVERRGFKPAALTVEFQDILIDQEEI